MPYLSAGQRLVHLKSFSDRMSGWLHTRRIKSQSAVCKINHAVCKMCPGAEREDITCIGLISPSTQILSISSVGSFENLFQTKLMELWSLISKLDLES